MYTHLFDYDNIFLNKIEAIVDGFLEIADINEEKAHAALRDRLIDFISLQFTMRLLEQIPEATRKPLVEKLNNGVSEETLTQIKSHFSDKQLLDTFHKAAKEILSEKVNLVKAHLTPDKVTKTYELLDAIGKY